jgi:hypothetical protein
VDASVLGPEIAGAVWRNAYLKAMVPALVPPTTGVAATAMEGAGITGVSVTAGATTTLKAALGALGLGLAGWHGSALVGLLQADTKSGTGKDDFTEIKIVYPRIKTP